MSAPDVDRSVHDWYRDAVIYELHVRTFADGNGDGIGDFRGLTQRLDYLRELGVTALWLLPFYPSPWKDDGYDIADYRGVHPAYGSLADVKVLLKEAHRRGLRVITELVLNHTSDQHAWFQRARNAPAGSRWRDWYVWSDTPDRYREARIIFQDFETSNWTWDPVAGAYFWHRFYSQQPDLNFENPEVQQALMKVVDFWFDLGVDGLRLDAVPYLFEAEGTNCENLPATHEFLQALRKHIDHRYPDRMLLAEANQWPEDAAAYFGQGDECHMNFHFPLMPRLFMGLQMEDRFPIVDILQQTPEVPAGCQWALFLRNHDELTLEMVTDEERDYMYRVYARDRQARINLGIRRRLAPLLDRDRAKIQLLNGLLLSLPGTPVIYYGDEIGMGDNVYLGDRDGVRTPMQWSADRNAGFSTANPQKLYLPVIIDPAYHYEAVNVQAEQDNPNSLLWWMRRILALRQRHPVFGRGGIDLLHPDNPHVLAYVRCSEDEDVVVVANLSRHAQVIELDMSRWLGATPVEMFGQTRFPPIGDLPYMITLGPYDFYWFSIQAVRDEASRSGEPPVLTTTGRTWSAAFERGGPAGLAGVLQRFLPTQRWYAGKDRQLRDVAVLDLVKIPGVEGEGGAHLAVVEATFGQGEPDRYVVPMMVVAGERAGELARFNPGAVIAQLRGPQGEALLVDAMADPNVPNAFLQMIQRRRKVATPAGGELQGNPGRHLRDLVGPPGTPLEPSLSKGEQSNSNVMFGDRLVLKVFRRMAQGRNPDHEVLEHLAAVGTTSTPLLGGAIEYHADGQEVGTLALLTQLVPNEGDTWGVALGELGRRYEWALVHPDEVTHDAPDVSVPALLARSTGDPAIDQMPGSFLLVAELLGARLAELHRALADPRGAPGFAAEPLNRLYQRSLYQSLRNRCQRTLQQLERGRRHLDEATQALVADVVAARDDILGRMLAVTTTPMAGGRIRIHGDLHLGQVLWTGRDAVFIDFEGEPLQAIGERRIKRSPYRDVAGMLRSFDYASRVALQDLRARGMSSEGAGEALLQAVQRSWYAGAAGRFLQAYHEGVAGAPFASGSIEETTVLLQAFLLEKALYEVAYEMASRPSWVGVPLSGLADLLHRGTDRA